VKPTPQRLVEREELGSTGIGKGIAIPHSRSLLVSKLELAIGRSTKGVSFDTIDKKPAHLFFLIVAPPQDQGNQYLVALGRVALVSQNLARNKQYLVPKTPQEMIQLIRDAEEKIR
jgi:PTS system nitrogen regulatory IIA component